jgi:transcriptional regulator with XRE-family HTH domain
VCFSCYPASARGIQGDQVSGVLVGPPSAGRLPRSVESVDTRNDIREFLTSRRARITPDQAGLPAFGTNCRVKGLRREEVALLAGISAENYVRLERGNMRGVSEDVLDNIARALQLDEPERMHLFDLARGVNDAPHCRSRRQPTQEPVRPVVQRILDSLVAVPAFVRNERLDVLAANHLGEAFYAPLYADPGPTGQLRPVRLPQPTRHQVFSIPPSQRRPHTMRAPTPGQLGHHHPAGPDRRPEDLMEIKPKRPSLKGLSDWFTGDVWIDGLVQPDEHSPLNVGAVNFSPEPAPHGTLTTAARPST